MTSVCDCSRSQDPDRFMARLATIASLCFVVTRASGAIAEEPPQPAEVEQRAEQTEAPKPAPGEPPPSTWDRERAENNGKPALEPKEGVSWTAQLAKTVVALLFVVALIYLLFKVGLGRLLGYATVKSGGKALNIVERAQLDARHALFLVELGPDNRLLVGTGEQGVQVLARVDASGRSKGDASTTSSDTVVAHSANQGMAPARRQGGGSDEED